MELQDWYMYMYFFPLQDLGAHRQFDVSYRARRTDVLMAQKKHPLVLGEALTQQFPYLSGCLCRCMYIHVAGHFGRPACSW